MSAALTLSLSIWPVLSCCPLRARFTPSLRRSHCPVPFTTDAATLTLGGAGTATVYLNQNPTADGWVLARVDYNFDRALPEPWAAACENPVDPPIGPVYCPPFDVVSGDTFIVSGTGDFWGQFDGGHYVYRQVTGDTTVIAHVRGQSSSRPFAKAGIMLRASSFPPSPYVILDVKPDGQIEFMMRPALVEPTQFLAGGDALMTDPWLQITRRGDVFSGYISADGEAWSPVGSVQLSMPATLLASLAVSNWDTSGQELNTAVFDDVSIESSSQNLLVNGDFEQSITPTLSPWQSDDSRQTAAYAESFQPRSGNNNAACWTTSTLDCGLYTDVRAPRTATVHSHRLRHGRPRRWPGGSKRQPGSGGNLHCRASRLAQLRRRVRHDLCRAGWRHHTRVDVFAVYTRIRRHRRREPCSDGAIDGTTAV